MHRAHAHLRRETESHIATQLTSYFMEASSMIRQGRLRRRFSDAPRRLRAPSGRSRTPRKGDTRTCDLEFTEGGGNTSSIVRRNPPSFFALSCPQHAQEDTNHSGTITTRKRCKDRGLLRAAPDADAARRRRRNNRARPRPRVGGHEPHRGHPVRGLVSFRPQDAHSRLGAQVGEEGGEDGLFQLLFVLCVLRAGNFQRRRRESEEESE